VRATVAWSAYLVAGAGLAAYAVVTWSFALVERRSVLYGEGAVANAARLARDGIAYLDVDPQRFVAANYPPLYFHLASIGDPFISGRIASIVATLLVAALVLLIARSGGWLVGAALALGFVATAPVAVWGPALKPDLVALALTAIAVVTLDRRRDLAAVAGFVIVLAAFAKPTALLPALAIGTWLGWTDRSGFARFGFGAAVAVLGAAITVYLDSVPDVLRHVVTWNALGWSAEQALLLGVLAIVVLGISVGVAAIGRGFGGVRLAYLVGALGILVLGGREGATINYALDLTVATSLALASIAPRIRGNVLIPAAILAQLVIGTVFVDPLRVVPGRVPTTGAWSDPTNGGQVALFFSVSGRYLVEDSGLLAATGNVPVVDDLFLWSRLVERGLIDGSPILDQVRGGRMDAVVSQIELEHLDAAPAFERQRWTAALVSAVLARYRLETHAGALWIYVPR
jgi:hypothetical protein